ncbi:Protein of unknown function [Gryllus bimaculatus]|nr:Protein of unknown function [Gryllus bimaculatus]
MKDSTLLALNEEPPTKPGLELPAPGPRVPAPSAFPQGRWVPPEESAAYIKMRAEDREMSRRRWRRWFLAGSRRHTRHRGDSQPTPLAEGEGDATGVVLGELANITAAAAAIAEEEEEE